MLADRAERIAAHLDAGDDCAALDAVAALETLAHDHAATGAIGDDVVATLLATTSDIAGGVHCDPPPADTADGPSQDASAEDDEPAEEPADDGPAPTDDDTQGTRSAAHEVSDGARGSDDRGSSAGSRSRGDRGDGRGPPGGAPPGHSRGGGP